MSGKRFRCKELYSSEAEATQSRRLRGRDIRLGVDYSIVRISWSREHDLLYESLSRVGLSDHRAVLQVTQGRVSIPMGQVRERTEAFWTQVTG